MRILILGGDGYLGWPTAMHFAAQGHDVAVVDNYLRRTIALQTQSEALIPTPDLPARIATFNSHSGHEMRCWIGDLADYRFTKGVFEEFQPEAVIHYAEQPSAPYSMMGYDEASLTLKNNVSVTFNVIWATMEVTPDCHLVKLGTMGEYGTPNIEIEEGWIDIDHKGRQDRFLFPRQAGSLYHTTKVLDTDLLWFYVRTFGLRVTDLMQGPVYGLSTPECDADPRLVPNFHYDDIFGTVVNRFLAQAVAGIPLTVYGKGGQTRGYLNLLDTLACVDLAVSKTADRGELRIFNQFTETFSVNDLAGKIQKVGNEMGLGVEVQNVDNPRKESEDHFYQPAHSALIDLGLEPNYMTDDVVAALLDSVLAHKDSIDPTRVMPRVRWK